ncbi:MAG: hypothetical protein ACI9TH_003710 [Kiritimatiellia bacterium]|jgi:hypothetical protein
MSFLHETNQTMLFADMTANEQTNVRASGWGRLRLGVLSLAEWLFGVLALIFGLAFLSALPVLNLLVLGYLLEVSARVSASGRWRDGPVGVRKAAVLGRMALGTWLVLWPARLVSDLWQSATLVNPSGEAKGWRVFLIVIVVWTLIHICWSIIRGGKLRHFFWPAPLRFVKWLGKPKHLSHARDAVFDYIQGLQLPGYFWMGLRGFVGAASWLVIPVALMILASALPQGGNLLLSLLGGLILAGVILYLPFLEVRFAVERRFGAMYEVAAVRAWFRRAPVAFFFAFLITLLLSIPLYALKVEMTPQEVAFLPGLLFVILGFPARVMTGWAVGRAQKREQPRHGFFCFMSRVAVLPLAFAYVLLLYLSQFFSWHGVYSLLEQHAFLVPAPLLEWVWVIF